MAQKFDIAGLHCLCGVSQPGNRIAYILYPMDMLDGWIDTAARRYGVTIVALTGFDWDNCMSPWPAKGVPRGCPDFGGHADEFLKLLTATVLPAVEGRLGFGATPVRTLVGVSMSGLFTLWQWMLCDAFVNIASLSGSFWYSGFLDWIKGMAIPRRTGKAFFLLGDKESASRVKAFDSVGVNTRAIVSLLHGTGIDTSFTSVPGNHYADPLPRLDRAFSAIFAGA